MSSPFKGPSQEREGILLGGSERAGREKKGLQWGMLGGERGTGVTPASLSQKWGLRGVGRGSRPSSWLVPCEALRFLCLPSEGLCFACKQWQWPQLAWPSAASKLAAPRKEGGEVGEAGVSIGMGYKGIAGGSRHVLNTSPFRPLMSCLCPPWESSGGTKAPLLLPPSPKCLFQG